MVEAVDELAKGREAYANRAWADAFDALSRADEASALAAEDLDRLSTAAYMLGRDDDYAAALERGYHAHLEGGEPLAAVRRAFWLGMHLFVTGKHGHAMGWAGRAQRLVDAAGQDCVERGYLLIPLMFRHMGAGDMDAAAVTAAEARMIGERFGDADLAALTGVNEGQFLVRLGRVEEGLRLLDEAMLAVSKGELSPIPSGLVYCGVISGCQGAYELGRAREWTAALATWCDQQPDMVAFTGTCQVHRAEILQLQGAWRDALDEVRRAKDRCLRASNTRVAGIAVYLQGELHRVRGDVAAAEAAYREASRFGCEPQPGLALLRLAQGQTAAAAASLRRVLAETSDRVERARLLPAGVEILVAAGDVDGAAASARELEEIAADHRSAMLEAVAAQARGTIALAEDDHRAALVGLRNAARLWDGLDAPYEAARARVLVGVACRSLGDGEAAALELEAARETFEALGATTEVARVDSLAGRAGPIDAQGLTARELEVLRLVAAGRSNKAIAADLVLSERTVERHLSNIFAKLRVSSRAAATAYAYEHQLV